MMISLHTVRRCALVLALLLLPAMAQREGAVQVVAARPDETRILASGEIRVEGEPSAQISLVATDARIWLRIRGGDDASLDAPITVPLAPRLLAHRRFAFLWDALIDWAGEDLTRLRDAHLAWTLAAMRQATPAMSPRNSAQSMVRAEIAARIQHAEALTGAGRGAEAVALLRAGLPAELRTSEEKMEFSIVSTTIARLMRLSGDYSGSITQMDDSIRRLGSSDFRLNLLINRASYHAVDGRYREALRDADAALAGALRGPAHLQVAGSRRHFDWVRACALAGLGRGGEARALAAGVAVSEEPSSALVVLETSGSIRRRMNLCRRDAASVTADLIEAARASPLSDLPLWLQPGFEPRGVSAELVAAVRADAQLRRIATEQLRPLPAALLPAMRSWYEPRN